MLGQIHWGKIQCNAMGLINSEAIIIDKIIPTSSQWSHFVFFIPVPKGSREACNRREIGWLWLGEGEPSPALYFPLSGTTFPIHRLPIYLLLQDPFLPYGIKKTFSIVIESKLYQGTWLMPYPRYKLWEEKGGELVTDLLTKALLGQPFGSGNYCHGYQCQPFH